MKRLGRILALVGLLVASGADAQVAPIAAYTCTVAAITVTNASQQFLAANGLRKVLIVQDNDASANLFVNFGAAAVVAGSIKVAAGGSLYMSNPLPVQSVNIIGSTASNGNVSLTECQ